MADTSATPPAIARPWQRWARRAAIALGALLLLWALAWLGLPPLIKSQAQSRLSALLGRSVTIGAVDLKPWSLELTVTDLAVGPAAGASQPLLQLGRLYVNADAASIWRRAPVLSALELDALHVNVARTGPGHYDLDDMLARFAAEPAAPPGPAEPARLALYNVQLRDASLAFDDRPAGRVHRVEALHLALPFLSTIPADVDVTVEPHLAFRLNGVGFDSGAQATPFAKQRHGELKLAFADLDLAPYLGYLPPGLPVRLQRGALSADLALRFEWPQGGEPAVLLRGSTQASDIALAEPGGAPLLAWKRLQLGLRDVQPLARRLGFGALQLDGLQLDLRRDAQGRLNLASLAAPGAASAPAPAASAAPAGQPWQVALDRLELAGARVRWNDATTRPAAALQLEDVSLQSSELRWPLQGGVPLKLAATLRPQADGAAPAGSLRVEGRAGEQEAQADLTLDALALGALEPYVAQALQPALAGRLSAQAHAEWNAATPALTLKVAQATLDGLTLTEGSGRAAREPLALAQLQWRNALIDLQAHSAALGSISLSQPALEVQREADGRWNLQRWAVAAPAPTASTAPPAPAPAASAAAPWRVQLDEFAIDGGRVRYADALASGRAGGDAVQAEVQALKLRLQGLAWPGGRGVAPAKVQLAARLGAPATGRSAARSAAAPAGSLEWTGRLAPEPLLVAGNLKLDRFPVQLFEPYFGEKLRVSLLHADAAAKAEFSVQALPAGLAVKAGGDLRVADVRVHTRAEPGASAGDASTSELLSWQVLVLDGLRFSQQPGGRPALELREATLSDFFARLMITEQGRFNLSGLAGPADAASAPAAGASAPAVATVAAASAPEPAASAPPADAALPIDIAVGGVNLVNGRIDFTDHFVRPNYSADLSQLNGRLGAFRSGTRDMATLELRGRAAGTALLDIRGALNPTASPLALDIQAKATDLELAPLSPYAGKYAGYAIERGKLSMDVAYKISPDGKLEARNQVILNQLTFGDKVESPDATKLPVQLALALLKDRNGVIDINLPISGSINDPQFSVFGIVLKLIGNLLVKALTAPFSLLFGGGGEELNYVEFRPGTALLTEAGQAALAKVAKALTEREALKMTVTGAADPVSEREDYQRAVLEARLLAERRRELLRAGTAPAEVDALTTLDAPTRSRLLRAVYKATDIPNKPRNALGFAKDIPEPEMEALLRSRTLVTVEAMRELALQRGLAVRDALIAQGLPSERLFLAAPKLRASGEDDAAWTPRVQLSLAAH